MTRGMDAKSSILIVDDDMGMCETLSDIMEDRGYRTVVALDGYEAVERVREAAFDVILMDIKMPGMDGVQTFREIKNVDPETAVVMMTAYAIEDLIREALREGAYGVLYKPLDMERVMSLIEDISGGRLILVVDDDPNTCATLKDILEARGYKVGTALDGERAQMRRDLHRYEAPHCRWPGDISGHQGGQSPGSRCRDDRPPSGGERFSRGSFREGCLYLPLQALRCGTGDQTCGRNLPQKAPKRPAGGRPLSQFPLRCHPPWGG